MTQRDQREHVRSLARQIAQIAASAEQEAIHKRWRDVNALRRPDRAPVYCRPVGCWTELLPEETLSCTDPWLRSIERDFRRMLIKHEIGDDDPIEPYFAASACFDCDPINIWGVDITRHDPASAGGAWGYDPPLKSESDFDRLRLPVFTHNERRTRDALSRAHDLLGDILPVKLVCGPPIGATMNTAADLRGLSQMMMDMVDRPGLLHRLMAYLRDAALQSMDQVESTDLLTPNNTGAMLCSDPVGPAPLGGAYTCANLWAMANSQEFDQVSPAMWQEFCLDYQMPILTRYGLTAYGCCENLTNKIDGVLSIPNLRIFVCSAWTDLDTVIERVGRDYTIMWRQKASSVVYDDIDQVARGLDEGMRRLKGCHYQVVLRELQTLAGQPDRLHVWTRLAIDSAERHA